jgi:2-polyprenyl-6-methoxyphenol hydroxylase-like FAD-dependent oxidoreductase
MRVLIVGGGIAGLTLAALLQQRGIHPLVVEKAAGYGGVGYVLGLWPLGSRVLKGLGLYQPLVERSVPLRRYRPCDVQGRCMREYDFDWMADRSGPILGVRRLDLIELLRQAIGDLPLRMGETVGAVEIRDQDVGVTFSDGSGGEFDLVVGCDGLRSKTRELVFGNVPLVHHGWTGYAWWLDPALCPSDVITEYWTAGRFLGLYPAKDSLCCFCAVPAPQHVEDQPAERPEKLRKAFAGVGGLVPQVIDQLPRGEEIWHDDFDDVRLPRWSRGRVLLIGDASAAILPTAGIGASMAMESAAALADELSRADAASIDLTIRLFVKRRRKRVDSVQTASRRLLRLSLLRSRALTAVRNRMVPWFSDKQLLGSLVRVLETPF